MLTMAVDDELTDCSPRAIARRLSGLGFHGFADESHAVAGGMRKCSRFLSKPLGAHHDQPACKQSAAGQSSILRDLSTHAAACIQYTRAHGPADSRCSSTSCSLLWGDWTRVLGKSGGRPKPLHAPARRPPRLCYSCRRPRTSKQRLATSETARAPGCPVQPEQTVARTAARESCCPARPKLGQ